METDERLAILRMLEDRQITADEALQLLAAVEPDDQLETVLPDATVEEEAWMLSALLQVTEALAGPGAEGLPEILERVVRIVPLLAGVDQCGILLWQPDQAEWQSAAWRPASAAASPPAHGLDLARQGRPAVHSGAGAYALLPMAAQDAVIGAMYVAYGGAEHTFSEKEIAILANIARQVAIGVENMRLRVQAVERAQLGHELELAHDLQASLLPGQAPAIAGWDIAAYWSAARTVGGDFYDFVPLAGSQLGIVIADVSDKGMLAALFMTLARSTVRACVARGRSLARALQRANRLICADAHDGMFVTLFYAVIDAAGDRVRFACAGHNPALHFSGRDVAALEAPGIALGVLASPRMQERSAPIALGDVLVFYTDGLTEAVNAQQEAFGLAGVIDIVHRNAHEPAAVIVERLTDAVATFAGDQPAFDDLTLLVVRRV